MITVSILCAALALVSLMDRRAHPFVFTACVVWVLTAFADTIPDRLQAIAFRVPIDVVGAAMGMFWLAVFKRRETWAIGFVSVFSLMLLNHGAYWLARWNGVDIWTTFAHGLNLLLLLQFGLMAVPGGLQGVRLCSAWAGLVRRWWSRSAGVGAWQTRESHRADRNTVSIRNRRADVGTDCRVSIPTEKA